MSLNTFKIDEKNPQVVLTPTFYLGTYVNLATWDEQASTPPAPPKRKKAVHMLFDPATPGVADFLNHYAALHAQFKRSRYSYAFTFKKAQEALNTKNNPQHGVPIELVGGLVYSKADTTQSEKFVGPKISVVRAGKPTVLDPDTDAGRREISSVFVPGVLCCAVIYLNDSAGDKNGNNAGLYPRLQEILYIGEGRTDFPAKGSGQSAANMLGDLIGQVAEPVDHMAQQAVASSFGGQFATGTPAVVQGQTAQPPAYTPPQGQSMGGGSPLAGLLG